MNITLRPARNSDQPARLVWDCPECGDETTSKTSTPREEIATDPLCCYCRARLMPDDTRNKLRIDDNGKTFRRRETQ